ncbi:hypothetical protein CBR67_01830 [Bordetella hinzii]|uniref:DUF748 domain-containing protein n=1 Tax=Bordetella hinzii TaxID=103855 RepID=UPI00114DE6AC|nr:DUF748 domain-containing protein [Bordetella hinzii]QDJ35486.1 hypothetical protein CBR67_01830 [Bordetella hinzii]
MSFRMPALKLSRRGAKILGAVVLVMLLLAGLAAWQVPKVLRGALTGDVAALLGRDVSVGDISFNPFTLTVRAHDLAIAQPRSETPLLKVGLLEASAAWRSLLWFAPVVDSVRVVDPQVDVVREDVTRFNFSDIQQKLAEQAAKAPPDPQPKEGLPRFSLNNMRLEGGRIRLDDKVTGRKQVIDEITLGVPFISTFGYATDIDVQPKVHLRVNGSPFDLDGVARPFDKVPHSTLNLNFSGLELEKWADIWPMALPVKLQRALLDSDLQVRFEQPKDAPPAVKVVGDVGLRQLDVREASGDNLLKWSSLVVRRISTEPLKQQLYIGEVELWAPQAQTRRDAEQRVNWLEVIDKLRQLGAGGKPVHPAAPPAAPAPGPAASSQPVPPAGGQAAPQAQGSPAPSEAAPAPQQWQVAVDAINVRDAELHLRDAATRLDYLITGLDLTVETVQLPQPPKQPIQIWASMENSVDGGWLRAKGPLRLEPLALDMELHMGNVALAPFAPAVQAAAPLVIKDGRLALDTRIRLAQANGATQASAHDLKLSLSRLAARDEGIKPAVDISLGQLDVGADQLSLGATPSNFTLKAADIQGKGQLAMQGVFTSSPVTLKSQVDLSSLDLAPFAPYVASSLNATVRAVTVGARGQAEFAMGQGSTPMTASWRGAAEVSDFDLQDRVNKADFLNWGKLALSNMQVALRGTQFSANLGDIVLDDFYGRVLLNAEGRLNIMDLVAEPGQAGGSITQDTQTRARPAPAKAASAMPDISLNSVTLTRGKMNFTDRFVKPNYTAELSAIEGSVSAVSSRNPQPARVKVGGRVYTTAPFSISGTVQPFAQYLALDIKASAKGVDLPRFTTYSAKYVGYPIKRGKLSLDVEYKIKNRELQASNRVVLNQLTLGDKTDSKDALQLPVLLAVALLKDSKGNIDINLPISGSLDDPQFSVGGIIVRVFVNLIVKAVTSPFSLLASVFGGGEELSYIEFAPGSAELSPDSEERLQTLAKALNDRPSLKLDIAGRADPKTDEEGLRQAWVDRQIRLAKARETAGRGKKPNPEGVTVSAAERGKYLEKVYDDTKIEGKPRNFIGIAKSIPADQMEALLRGAATITQDDLRKLADARAQAVFEKLQAEGPADRIFIVAPVLDAEGIKDDGKPSRVDFSLK